MPRLVSVLLGYAAGHTDNPTHERVRLMGKGHVEAVQVVLDPRRVLYDLLLGQFL